MALRAARGSSPRGSMGSQTPRTVIALVFVAAILAFFVWFAATHLGRTG